MATPKTTATIPATRDEQIAEMVAIYEALPLEDKRLLNRFIVGYSTASETDKERIHRFAEATKMYPIREVMEFEVAALMGSKDAWGVIDATIEEQDE